MILLMLIGGSPGSTAGGMKTTTFTILILNTVATFRSREEVSAFGRRIDSNVIKNAATIAMESCSPISDIRASKEYRSAMVRVFTKRAIKKALEDMQEVDHE